MNTYPEAILGYRIWRVKNYTSKSVELYQLNLLPVAWEYYEWQATGNLAQCPHHTNCPEAHCHCGFNAYHSLKQAKKHLRKLRKINKHENYLLGAIAGAGKTMVHANGFRCQKAQIIAFYHSDDKIKNQLRQNFPAIPVFAKKKEFTTYCQNLLVTAPRATRPACPKLSERLYEHLIRRYLLTLLVGLLIIPLNFVFSFVLLFHALSNISASQEALSAIICAGIFVSLSLITILSSQVFCQYLNARRRTSIDKN